MAACAAGGRFVFARGMMGVVNHDTTRRSLLIRVRDPQDQGAWYEFDECYRELILRYCRAKGLQPADAEDVRQMVMISLSSAMRNFEYQPAKGRFRGYLGRIVSNAVARHHARRSAELALDVDALESAGAAAEAAAQDEDDPVWEREWVDHHYRRAMDALRRVVEPQSIAVFEKLLSGAGVDDVAREMSIAAANVYKIRQRMRDRLQELIAEQIREEDESFSNPGR